MRYLILTVAMVLVVGGGIAVAQPEDDGTVINACAKTNNGQLRIVDSSDDCKNSEYFVSWNAQGDKGDKGDTGPTGATGDQGVKGDKGDTGDPGAPGAKGDKGDTGTVGEQGEKGDTGEKGDKGDQGLQGLKGDKGDTGDQGPKGDPGDDGDDGENGAPGADGANGMDGVDGQSCSVVEDPSGTYTMTCPDSSVTWTGATTTSPLPGCTEDGREPDDSKLGASYMGSVQADVSSVGPVDGCRKVENDDWYRFQARDGDPTICYPGVELAPLLVEVQVSVSWVGTPLEFSLWDDGGLLDDEVVAPSDGQIHLNASWPDVCGQDDNKDFYIRVGYDPAEADMPAPDRYENAYTWSAWAPTG